MEVVELGHLPPREPVVEDGEVIRIGRQDVLAADLGEHLVEGLLAGLHGLSVLLRVERRQQRLADPGDGPDDLSGGVVPEQCPELVDVRDAARRTRASLRAGPVTRMFIVVVNCARKSATLVIVEIEPVQASFAPIRIVT